MSAFFFGPAPQPRFGCFHPARGSVRGAALLCPSWGPEYQYAHRALRVLAKRLSERGVHALRFDYSGTGDSWGDSTDASMQRWVEDVHLATQHLRTLAGTQRVDLVGLRIGAAVACTAAAGMNDLRRLALLDPVLEGAAWTAAHDAPMAIAGHAAGQGIVEFAQMPITAALLHDFTALKPGHYARVPAEAVLVLRTQGEGPPSPLPAEGAFVQAAQQFVPDVAPWLEDASIWSGQVPARALRTLVDWIVA